MEGTRFGFGGNSSLMESLIYLPRTNSVVSIGGAPKTSYGYVVKLVRGLRPSPAAKRGF